LETLNKKSRKKIASKIQNSKDLQIQLIRKLADNNKRDRAAYFCSMFGLNEHFPDLEVVQIEPENGKAKQSPPKAQQSPPKAIKVTPQPSPSSKKKKLAEKKEKEKEKEKEELAQ